MQRMKSCFVHCGFVQKRLAIAALVSTCIYLTIGCTRWKPLQYFASSATFEETPTSSSKSPTGAATLETTTTAAAATPVQHILYLKTHKTGSSTMYSIFAEYCRSHELLSLLPPITHINQGLPFREKQLLLHPGVRKYYMVFSHHIFTPRILKYLPDDTFFVTMLREPFTQFVSSLFYYKSEHCAYLKNLRGPDIVNTFLANPSKFETPGYASFTNNRQSMDLGFDIRHSFNETAYIENFIKTVDKYFNLVLITDYFDESLILLKRVLGWTTGDILYFRKNVGETKFEPKDIPLSVSRQRHARFAQADIALYGFFLKQFQDRLKREANVYEEVAEFEKVLEKVYAFCEQDVPQNGSLLSKRLDIPKGRWTTAVTVLASKCKWLKMDERDFTNYLKARQSEILTFPSKGP